ncbi:MAG: hypothetical protein WCS94_03850, partial [Verrucomicrobiota bacterium]
VKQAIANSEQGLNAKFADACHAAPDGPRKHRIFTYSRQTTWLETTNPERVNIEETAQHRQSGSANQFSKPHGQLTMVFLFLASVCLDDRNLL